MIGWHSSMSPYISCHQHNTQKEAKDVPDQTVDSQTQLQAAVALPRSGRSQKAFPRTNFAWLCVEHSTKTSLAPVFFVGHFFTQTLPTLPLCSQAFLKAAELPPLIAPHSAEGVLPHCQAHFSEQRDISVSVLKHMRQKCRKFTPFSLATQLIFLSLSFHL